jgi:DNA-binding CsgD family transcriptional regulator
MKKSQKPILKRHELESLTWSARGLTSDEIAQTLGSTKRNVDFYLDNARAKLGAVTRIQAVAMAIQEKLINP